jgi:hypothetical protein
MQDRPTYAELLDAVRHFLESDVVPRLEGPKKFHARVAANVLAIVERELASEDTQLRTELGRLQALLGESAAHTRDRQDLRDTIRKHTSALCDRIRAGDADAGEWRAAVFSHVRASVREKLEVANPKYLEADDTLRAQTGHT